MVPKYAYSIDMIPNLAYSIDQFCRLNNLGKTTLYRLLREGNGPKVMKVGRRTLISVEAAENWRNSLNNNFKSKLEPVDIESKEIV